jgi:hypothetical protein
VGGRHGPLPGRGRGGLVNQRSIDVDNHLLLLCHPEERALDRR